MRTAVCLSGEMRGCSKCLELLQAHIITPFQEAGYEVDLFLHTRKDDWWKPAGDLQFRGLWVEENRHRDDSLIISKHNPREQGDRRPTSMNDRRSFLYQSYLQQYWSLYAVGQMKKRAELQDGKLYDWVVRSRPDVYLEAPLPVRELDPKIVSLPWNEWWPYEVNGVRVETANDRFAVGSSKHMDVYFNKLGDLKEFCTQYRLQGEWFTAWQLDSVKIPWIRHDKIKCLQTELKYTHSKAPDER